MTKKRDIVKLMEGYLKAQSDLVQAKKETNEWSQHHIDIIQRQVEWYKNEIQNFGRGTIIEVSGFLRVQNKKVKTAYTLKPFKFYLIDCTVGDAEIFFNNIVKSNYLIDTDRTLSFKEIKSSTIITS